MAVNGLTDIVATVSVPKSEYEELIRESNTLRILENVIKNSDGNISTYLIKDILGMNEESEEFYDGSSE